MLWLWLYAGWCIVAVTAKFHSPLCNPHHHWWLISDRLIRPCWAQIRFYSNRSSLIYGLHVLEAKIMELDTKDKLPKATTRAMIELFKDSDNEEFIPDAQPVLEHLRELLQDWLSTRDRQQIDDICTCKLIRMELMRNGSIVLYHCGVNFSKWWRIHHFEATFSKTYLKRSNCFG